jgi:hypothetical protein
VCVLYVAAAMIEFAVLLHLKRTSETIENQDVSSLNIERIQPPSKILLNVSEDNENGTEEPLNVEKFTVQDDEVVRKQGKLFLRKTKRIDYITLFVSSMTFCLFNCIYWIYYLLF